MTGRIVETLIKNADLAMYHAKKNGSQNYRFFRQEMILERREASFQRARSIAPLGLVRVQVGTTGSKLLAAKNSIT